MFQTHRLPYGQLAASTCSFTSCGPIAAPAVALQPKVCETCRLSFLRPVQDAKAEGPRVCHRCAPVKRTPKLAFTRNSRHIRKAAATLRVPIVPVHLRLVRQPWELVQ